VGGPRVEARPDRLATGHHDRGPIGAASFNNEFGRPNLAGYFRTYEQEAGGVTRGYHKPIMLAGGVGNIRAADAHRPTCRRRPAHPARRPGMLIGMGGGSASYDHGNEHG